MVTALRVRSLRLQGAGDEPYLVTCREHAEIRDEMELVPLMPVMPDQKVSVSPPDHVPTRPRNARTEVDDPYQPDSKGCEPLLPPAALHLPPRPTLAASNTVPTYLD